MTPIIDLQNSVKNHSLDTPQIDNTNRHARTLIGWLSVQEGTLSLAGHQLNQIANPEYVLRCEQARAAVAARALGVNQENPFSSLPTEVMNHIEQLWLNPISANELATAGEPMLVDLMQICAAQPHIFVEYAMERVAGIDASDLKGLAAITLPIPTEKMIKASFDSTKNIWVFSSANPHLRIVGGINVPVGLGRLGFGFQVEVANSYLQVAGVNGRYFLRDGYHRAYGLLAAGIRYVPGLVKDFSSFEEVGLPQGMLLQEAYLGDRPALLLDYLNNEVAADTTLVSPQKTVVLQALELNVTN
jgi:hypothetical protein